MDKSGAVAVAGKAKGLGLLMAALIAGGTAGGLISADAASGSSFTLRTSAHGAHDRATPHATDSPGADGVHGRCVSKVARDHEAVGGPHHNHGGAVSAAAHSCPH